MNVQPYLSFEGRAQEAIDFYKSALGAKVDMVMHFKDAPPEVQSQMSPASKDKIMHAAFHIGGQIGLAVARKIDIDLAGTHMQIEASHVNIA